MTFVFGVLMSIHFSRPPNNQSRSFRNCKLSFWLEKVFALFLACETFYIPYHSVQPFKKTFIFIFPRLFLFSVPIYSAYLNDILENKCHNSLKLQHILKNLKLRSTIKLLKAFIKVSQYLILKVSAWSFDIR